MTTGPMAQVGWASACSDGDVGQLVAPPAAERAAGRGEHQPRDLVGRGRRAGTGRARSARSRPGRSGRAAPRPSPAGRPRPATPCSPAPAVAPVASAASVGPRPREPVIPLSTVSAGVVAVSSVAASGPASTSTPGQLPAQRGGRVRVRDGDPPHAVRPGLRGEQRDVRAAGRQAHHAEPVRPGRDHVQRLRADRAGRAEDEDAARAVGDRSVRRRGGHRRHSARAVRRCGTTGPCARAAGGTRVASGRGWSVVARTSRRAAPRAGVDPRDEPSAEWGWHGSFPNATRIAGRRRRDHPAGAADRARTRRTCRTSG